MLTRRSWAIGAPESYHQPHALTRVTARATPMKQRKVRRRRGRVRQVIGHQRAVRRTDKRQELRREASRRGEPQKAGGGAQTTGLSELTTGSRKRTRETAPANSKNRTQLNSGRHEHRTRETNMELGKQTWTSGNKHRTREPNIELGFELGKPERKNWVQLGKRDRKIESSFLGHLPS